MPQPTSAESDDNRACFGFPAIAGKKFSAGFDGGRLTSDGGVVLLGQAERQMGLPSGSPPALPIRATKAASSTARRISCAL